MAFQSRCDIARARSMGMHSEASFCTSWDAKPTYFLWSRYNCKIICTHSSAVHNNGSKCGIQVQNMMWGASSLKGSTGQWHYPLLHNLKMLKKGKLCRIFLKNAKHWISFTQSSHMTRGVPTRVPHNSIRFRLWELRFFDYNDCWFNSIIGATILRLLRFDFVFICGYNCK